MLTPPIPYERLGFSLQEYLLHTVQKNLIRNTLHILAVTSLSQNHPVNTGGSNPRMTEVRAQNHGDDHGDDHDTHEADRSGKHVIDSNAEIMES